MKKSPLCAACGKPLMVCRYNAHHQIYCNRSICVRRRKRKRQRESHNRRYQSDKDFRAKKQRKSREYMRERRSKEKAAAVAALQAEVCAISPMDVLTGVVSQLTDEDDPEVIHERLRTYSVRGRQLSHEPLVSGLPP